MLVTFCCLFLIKTVGQNPLQQDQGSTENKDSKKLTEDTNLNTHLPKEKKEEQNRKKEEAKLN